MKKLWLFAFLLPIFFTACEKDDVKELDNVLRYDGENATGPVLPFGTHTFAVRFGEEELKDYIGKSLNEITFFAGQQPEETIILVYGEGTNTTPGEEIYRAKINALATPDWNTHRIVNPIEITGSDIWLAVEVFHSQPQQSIGCDAGPNKTDGDWLDRFDNPGWKSFSAGTPENVNWNIRGIVE